MTNKKTKISSTIIPQSNYRKTTSKPLSELKTTIVPVGVNYPEKKELTKKVVELIDLIQHVTLKKEPSNTKLQKIICEQLFQGAKNVSTSIDEIWAMQHTTILNTIKIHYLNHHIEAFILAYEQPVGFLINKYKRHLPQHISYLEGDDLTTIAQLELIETFKAWRPEKNPDLWPLAYTRINGAMKDHIRYISKSDPTRFYDWVTDAAHLYLAINNDNSHESKIENSTMLESAMTQLKEKEKHIVKLYVNDDLTFSEISKRIQLSESQVSRIYKTALKKITAILKDNTPN